MGKKEKIGNDTFSGREEVAHDSGKDFAKGECMCIRPLNAYSNRFISFRQEGTT